MGPPHHTKMIRTFLWSDNNIVDWNVDQLNEKSNETHDTETNSCGNGDLLEFSAIWFGAPFDQSNWVLGKNSARFTEFHYLIHCSMIIQLQSDRMFSQLKFKCFCSNKLTYKNFANATLYTNTSVQPTSLVNAKWN